MSIGGEIEIAGTYAVKCQSREIFLRVRSGTLTCCMTWTGISAGQNLGRPGKDSVSSTRFEGALSFQFSLDIKQRIIAPSPVS
jgi:hypothetical protein